MIEILYMACVVYIVYGLEKRLNIAKEALDRIRDPGKRQLELYDYEDLVHVMNIADEALKEIE